MGSSPFFAKKYFLIGLKKTQEHTFGLANVFYVLLFL
jgi:hypothetical protein